MHKDVKKILFSGEDITNRCKVLGKTITNDYKDEQAPVLVGLLKGSVPFMTELMKYIELDVTIDFMDVSSYEGTESTGEIKILKDLDRSVKNMNVIIVEDIVDTGRTLKTVKKMLLDKGAKSVRIVTMMDKPEGRVVELKADYVGFLVPNEFVVGYGLDYNEVYRNLPYVGVLKEEVYK